MCNVLLSMQLKCLHAKFKYCHDRSTCGFEITWCRTTISAFIRSKFLLHINLLRYLTVGIIFVVSPDYHLVLKYNAMVCCCSSYYVVLHAMLVSNVSLTTTLCNAMVCCYSDQNSYYVVLHAMLVSNVSPDYHLVSMLWSLIKIPIT